MAMQPHPTDSIFERCFDVIPNGEKRRGRVEFILHDNKGTAFSSVMMISSDKNDDASKIRNEDEIDNEINSDSVL